MSSCRCGYTMSAEFPSSPAPDRVGPASPTIAVMNTTYSFIVRRVATNSTEKSRAQPLVMLAPCLRRQLL